MKKILFSLMALVASMSMNAQVMKVYNGETLVKMYKASEATHVVFVEEVNVSSITLDQTTASVEIGSSITLAATVNPSNATDASFTWSSSDPTVATVSTAGVVTTIKVGTTTIKATANDGSGVFGACELTVAPLSPLLPGVFSVSADKTVKFTRSNLYWDGSAFHFENDANKRTYTYNANHISHFYWTNTAETSYALNLGPSSDNNFWCDENHKITVDEIEDLYVLSSDEWNYLISGRANASALFKTGVKVGSNSNDLCLVVAPDGFTGQLKTEYTLQEVNTLGLLCMPLTNIRNGSTFPSQSGFSYFYGYYWTSTYGPNNNTSYPQFDKLPYTMSFRSAQNVAPLCHSDVPQNGGCIRLVK